MCPTGDDEDEGAGTGVPVTNPKRAENFGDAYTQEYDEIAALMDAALDRLRDIADQGYTGDALTRLEEARFWMTRAGAVPRDY